MAQLPPKIPCIPPQNWPPPFQRMPSLTNNVPQPQPQPQPGSGNSNPPSWVDEFLDFTSARRGTHRRSVSDSVAFLEGPHLVEECRNSSGTGGGGGGGGSGFDRLDDEQLMSMFSDDLGAGVVGPASSPSDQNSNNTDNNNNENCNPTTHSNVANNNNGEGNNDDDGQNHKLIQCFPKSEPGEVDSPCNNTNNTTTTNADNNNQISASAAAALDDATQLSGGDNAIDPKRVKRILANRQSAQRSRVRKLQYISELERSVTTLQTEVSALSPRVAFLDHQRLILNVDNSAIKQRIAALAQDKIFKDAHQEALKKEIERLRSVYQQQQQHHHQNIKKMNNGSSNNNNNVAATASDHNLGFAETEQLMT